MLIYSIICLLLSCAVILWRDKFILLFRTSILILLSSFFLGFFNFIKSLSNGIGLFVGLFHIISIMLIFHIFIFCISAIIIQLITLYPIRIKGYSYIIILDIYRGFRTAIVLFKPYNIFKSFLYLVFVGLISNLFICLFYKTQISLSIVFLGIIVEYYDNNKLNIKLFFARVFSNKTYYLTIFILRFLGFYLIITFLVCILPFNISVINDYLLRYLQVSLIKNYYFFLSFFGEVFSYIISYEFFPYVRCDSGNDWDDFTRNNPTVIMPRKDTNLSLVDPDIDRSKSLLRYKAKNGNWKPYYWNQYHSYPLKVYFHIEKPWLAPELPMVEPNPVADCRGFYTAVTERSKTVTYTPFEFINKRAKQPLYVKTTDGQYIKTPFRIQPGLQKLRD